MRFAQGSAVFLAGLLGLTIHVGCDSGVTADNYEDTNMESNYEVVFPERIDKQRTRRDMDYIPKEDDDHAKYKIHAFGRDLVLDIQKNKVTVPKNFIVRSFDDQGKEVIEESAVKNCQYQGHVQGEPDSIVLLDTCDGLRGIIDDNIEELSIEPLQSKGLNAHKLSRNKKYEQLNCGVKRDRPEAENDTEHDHNKRPRRSLAIDPLFRSHIAVKKTRYTELIIVVDNVVYKKYNSDAKDVERRVLTLVNAVDMIYQKINIRIILKSIEIWKHKDKVPFNPKAGPDLANFQKYKENNKQDYESDVVHLIRGKMWDDHGGMAYMTEMCTMRSTGVIAWNYWEILGPWLALAHEVGHNFGFDHDADRSGKCLTPRGCIMGSFKTRVPGFSDANLKDLKKIDDSCLYNIPEKIKDPQCGNGIKEGNEQCDCGTPENCPIVDPCCEPKTCKLYPSSQCSTRHDSCCTNCQIATTGNACRTAKGECDVPETCDGLSSQCPSDDHKMNGTDCHYNDMVLEGNNKSSQTKTTVLPRPIATRFLRINPKHWNKDICMRTELYGCDKLASAYSPTSIQSTNYLCVEAKYGTCNKNVKTELRFVQSECKENNNMFILGKDGVLIHSCTGNKVCPENNNWGAKLVVNKNCKKEASKFKRVGKIKALKHVQSGLCVHPKGGAAQDDTPLVLWNGCDKSRISLMFTSQDCKQPLGMANAKIPYNKITASSARANKDAMHSRLGGFNSWCAKILDQKQYLQIDLGKLKHITAIATEGTYDRRRVKEYHLFHSNDGKRWTAYTRHKKPQKNSCCISGKCAPTNSKKCGKKGGPVSGIFKQQNCPKVNGIVCAGNGICTSRSKCHCNKGFDPITNCASALASQDGGWGDWSKWSKCSRVCDGGTKQRHRFCDKPTPNNGGKKCVGARIEKTACKTPKCPVAQSCRHLQAIGKNEGKIYSSGVYTINPGKQGNVKTYCDMTRDGGGWTLLVTSHTNTWTARNVKRRFEKNPRLDGDFSILYKADAIKDSYKVQGDSFQYRIEAQEFGRWGGIWKAPRDYSFVATNNQQTKIKLVKKFDKWIYEDYGIEKRMPWVRGAMLTTSRNTDKKSAFGSIIANIKRFYPAPWINNKEQEQHPTNIWYWMREGTFRPVRSCMELQLAGLQNNKQLTGGGIHEIDQGSRSVKTYCDFSSEGGGWTLLLTSSSRNGWTKQTLLERNIYAPSFITDYSILRSSIGIIKNKNFQYKIDNGKESWGGIFEADAGQVLISTKGHQSPPLLLKKFGSWDEKTANLAKTVPYIRDPTHLLTTSTTPWDSSGTLVPLNSSGPSVIRLWIREGTWRSCNEIKIRAGQKSSKLTDGIYMIKKTPLQYLPVMCDMTSDPGAWTLLVTSAKNGWRKEQVTQRNIDRPSLLHDYSILKLGDQIKSLSGATTFKYKLEANSRGHWGGIWKAPIKYSFVATNNQQTDVKLLKKFDKWPYNSWKTAIEKRMPWLGKDKGLLTTSTHPTYYEYGSIIHNGNYNPSMWINVNGMTNPGIIWYWVNEDDCGDNRRPVNGAVSTWSRWSDCSPMCSTISAERTRRRTCTNPAPRCGGQSCKRDLLAVEKQRCVYCPKSPIKSINNLCIQPSTADCNPPDGTKLVYTQDLNNCNKTHMYFTLGKDDMLVHHCSKKKVCRSDDAEKFIILSSKCNPRDAKFKQTPKKALKHVATGQCVHPYQVSSPKEGTKLVTYYTCHEKKLKLDLFQLGRTVMKLLPPVVKSKPILVKLKKPTSSRATPRVIKTKSKPKPVKLKKLKRSRVSAIRSYGGFCLQPSTSNCSPPNGTSIIYHGTGGKNVKCNKNYMKFTLTKQGVLKHTCSNMYVCPEPDFYDVGEALWNGIPMVLKQNGCDPHKVHYTRTSAKSLRFKTSQFCVHPESGDPQSNAKAVFWNQCDLTRVALDFYELK